MSSSSSSRSSRTTAGPAVRVDWTRCDGHGTCADLLPELISRDDWGFPVVRDHGLVDARLRERADLAVAECPMLALRLVSAPRR